MRGWILVAALLAVIGTLVGWRMSKREDASPKGGMRGGGRNSTPTVKLEAASSLRIVEALETVGTIESPNNVQLSPKVSGRIEAVLVREGTEVVVSKSPEQFAAFLAEDTRFWERLVKDAGVTID